MARHGKKSPKMRKYSSTKPWVKLWWQGILYGSINADWNPHTLEGLARQMVFVRLMCLLRQSAGGEQGRFEYSPGRPWTLETIAEGARIDVDLLKDVIETSCKDARITILEDRTVVITNFPEKQRDTGRAKGLQIQLAKEKARAGAIDAVMSGQARVENKVDRLIPKNGNGEHPDIGWDFYNAEDGSAIEPAAIPVNLIEQIWAHPKAVIDKLMSLKVMARRRGS